MGKVYEACAGLEFFRHEQEKGRFTSEIDKVTIYLVQSNFNTLDGGRKKIEVRRSAQAFRGFERGA